jgi:hypothetical protein
VDESLLEQLFAAPLDEFVATRNRVAAELRGAGRRDEADAVKAMRKPAPVVWALNRLARTNGRGVGRLIELAEEMRAVQSGRSDASFAGAQRALADAAWKLAGEGARLLAEGGRRPAKAVTQRLDRALMAAVASTEAVELLRAGRLVEEPETVGFAGIGTVVESRKPRSRQQTARQRERERREAEKAAAQREKLDAAMRELRDAKADSARLSREAERAEQRVAELERRVARLRPR